MGGDVVMNQTAAAVLDHHKQESNRILGVRTAQWRKVDLQAQLQLTRLDAEGADRWNTQFRH